MLRRTGSVRLSNRLAVAVILSAGGLAMLGACGGSSAKPPAATHMVGLLRFAGGDRLTAEYASRVLNDSRIPMELGGSFMWTISVPHDQLSKAREVLDKQHDLLSYVDWFGGVDRSPSSAGYVANDVGLPYSESLLRYPNVEVIGRLLRDQEFLNELGATKGVVVDRVSWRERPFVSKTMKPAKAVQGTISATDPDGLKHEYSVFLFE